MAGRPLVPRRGEMGSEYIGDLWDFIARTNCTKGRGCVHAEQRDTEDPRYEWTFCQLGLLSNLMNEEEMPELEAHGNSYVKCLKRVEPGPPRPEVQPGPDLFGNDPEGAST